MGVSAADELVHSGRRLNLTHGLDETCAVLHPVALRQGFLPPSLAAAVRTGRRGFSSEALRSPPVWTAVLEREHKADAGVLARSSRPQQRVTQVSEVQVGDRHLHAC